MGPSANGNSFKTRVSEHGELLQAALMFLPEKASCSVLFLSFSLANAKRPRTKTKLVLSLKERSPG